MTLSELVKANFQFAKSIDDPAWFALFLYGSLFQYQPGNSMAGGMPLAHTKFRWSASKSQKRLMAHLYEDLEIIEFINQWPTPDKHLPQYEEEYTGLYYAMHNCCDFEGVFCSWTTDGDTSICFYVPSLSVAVVNYDAKKVHNWIWSPIDFVKGEEVFLAKEKVKLKLEHIAQFTWMWGEENHLDVKGVGEFIYSDPDYGGDNTIRRASPEKTISFLKKGPTQPWGRDKGLHTILSYCGESVKILD